MNDTVARIAEEAKERLRGHQLLIKSSAEQAAGIVAEAERNLDAVVGVASDFPDKLLSKYLFAATGEFRLPDDQPRVFDLRLGLNQWQFPLSGLFGVELKKGKYRVLMVVEQVPE